MHFLQELVQDYLILAHPQADLPQIEHAEEITHGDKEEDSFSQYYSSDIPKDKEKKKAAVKLKGEKLVHSDMHVTEVALSVKDIHRKARSCGVSITVLLTAMMLCSIREEIPKNQQKRPVALMIPVNLRNYFPSQSMTNFFGWIEVGYIFSDDRGQSGKQEHYGSLFQYRHYPFAGGVQRIYSAFWDFCKYQFFADVFLFLWG